MTLGSLPLWFVLVLVISPPVPSMGQVVNSSLVALFSGVCATSIFLYARNLASTSNELAGVDATQASEVIFCPCGWYAFSARQYSRFSGHCRYCYDYGWPCFFCKISNNINLSLLQKEVFCSKSRHAKNFTTGI